MADKPESDPISAEPVEAEDHKAPLAVDPASPVNPDEKVVYLPSLIADEYGISMEEANLMVRMGKVYFDDEIQESQILYWKEPDMIDKVIRVEGDVRTVQFSYKGPHRDRYTGDRFAE